MKVVVTGASGLLGRAVTKVFRAQGDEVVALAFSRADKDSTYTKLDLLDESAVRRFFQDVKTDAVIHCAAERRPDVAEAHPENARLINAVVPSTLAKLSKELGFKLIYISTDYVFDGFNPPYEVNDAPGPLQMYGRLKRDGEVATLEEQAKGAKATVLRVPVLYGHAEYNAESAVNILVDVVKDQSGKEYKMDDYQIRYPTNVEDVARVLSDLTRLESLPPLLHYSSPHKMTKYDMTKVIASHLKLPIDHVKADSQAPPKPKAGETPRPGNTQLSVKSLKELGIDTSEAKSFSNCKMIFRLMGNFIIPSTLTASQNERSEDKHTSQQLSALFIDRVQVAPGRMRHELFPRNLAHYIPWKRASERQVLRYRPSASDAPQISETSTEVPATAEAEVSPTPQDLLDKLYLAPEEVVFEKNAAEDAAGLFGSVTLSNVMERLNLPQGEYTVNWVVDENAKVKVTPGGRIKQLGDYKAQLQIRGRGEESVEILVRVFRGEAGAETKKEGATAV